MHKLAVLVIALGAAAASADSKPTLSLGTPAAVAGTLDVNAVTAVMKAASAKILACYKAEVAKHPGLAGTATATFKLALDGKVSSVTVTGLASQETAPVHNCIAGAISGLRFAKPKGGEVVEIAFPIAFSSIHADHVGWGTGFGGLHARTAAVPTASLGRPAVTGDLDKAIVRRYIKRNIQKIGACYETELVTKKTLQGTLQATFTIGVDGLVSSSTATGVDPGVATCVANVIKGIEFPKPKHGAVVVTYPFTFHAADPEPAQN